MPFSPLADMRRRIPDYGRSSERLSPVSGFIIHHNAGIDAYDQATAPGREVGAQYWITNAGKILPHVDESRRAFTSGYPGYPAGAEADHRSITVEVSNDGGPGWSISRAARTALAELIGDVHRRYNLGPVTRKSVRVHRDFVPTECPGPYIMQHLAEIIAEAETYRTGEDEMNADQEKKLDRVLAALEANPEETAKAVMQYKVTRHPVADKLGTTTLAGFLAKGETLARRNITRFDQLIKKLGIKG